MVYGAALEKQLTRKSLAGSNPALSAKLALRHDIPIWNIKKNYERPNCGRNN